MLKLGTQTGSLINHVMSTAKVIEPKIGMGVTFLHWTDRSAGTIVEVVSDSRIIIQTDFAERTDKNGMSECQTYFFRRNLQAPRQIFTKRKNGAWVREGSPMKSGQKILIGERSAYHDYSF